MTSRVAPVMAIGPNDHRLPFLVAAGGAAALGALLLGATVVGGLLKWVHGDVFALQTGGSAFIAFAVALAIETNANRPTRILLPAAIAGALGTAIAAALALLGPTGGRLGLTALVAGAGIAAMLGYLLLRSPEALPAGGQPISRWFTGFLVWGCVASALFGFGGLLLGSTFGKLFGFAGVYDLLYRLDGGITLGIFVGSVLSVRSRSWAAVQPVVIVAFVTNLLVLLAGVADAVSGGGSIGLYLITAASAFNAGCLGLGLARAGQ
jgi:hypothetical protein